jgi:hypothetical protein
MSRPLNSPKDADWYACPYCGAEVRVGSRGCLKCVQEAVGKKWQQDEYLDGVDLPDDPSEFDYNDFVKREFGARQSSRLKPSGVSWKWWIAGIILIGALAWSVAVPLFRH